MISSTSFSSCPGLDTSIDFSSPTSSISSTTSHVTTSSSSSPCPSNKYNHHETKHQTVIIKETKQTRSLTIEDSDVMSCSPPTNYSNTSSNILKNNVNNIHHGGGITSSMSNCSIGSILSCASAGTIQVREELASLLEGPWQRMMDCLPPTLADHIKLSYLKLHSTMYDVPRQIAMYNELIDIVQGLDKNIINNNNQNNNQNNQNIKDSIDIGVENYIVSVLSNNHLLWNVRNISSFVLKSPLFTSCYYINNTDNFADHLDSITRFYRYLVNDLIFQLFFSPYMHSKVCRIRSLHKPTYDDIAYRTTGASITMQTTIKILTEMKVQFELLENQFTTFQTRQQQQQQINQQPNNNVTKSFSLIESFSNILLTSVFLGHYNNIIGSYTTPSTTLLQRCILSSLTNFSRKIRSKMIEDQLFQSIFKLSRQDYLLLWMIGCSNNSQQHYLNTCNPSAYNLSYISKSPFISTLLTILKEILTKIELYKRVGGKKYTKAYPTLFNTAPSIYEFMELKMTKTEKMYKQLYQKCLDIIEKQLNQQNNNNIINNVTIGDNNVDDNINIVDNIFKLVDQWNIIMQSLSSIFSPSSPRILTKKPVASSWHLSAYIMTAYCSVSFFLPKQPKMFDRIVGTPPFFFEAIMFITYDYCFPKTSRYYTVYEDYAEVYASLTNPTDRLDSLNRLWEDCLGIGGVLFCSSEKIFNTPIGHLNYLFAIQFKGERVFLVGDPEITNFKLYKMKDMNSIILQDVFYFAGPKAD